MSTHTIAGAIAEPPADRGGDPTEADLPPTEPIDLVEVARAAAAAG